MQIKRKLKRVCFVHHKPSRKRSTERNEKKRRRRNERGKKRAEQVEKQNNIIENYLHVFFPCPSLFCAALPKINPENLFSQETGKKKETAIDFEK